MSNETVLSANWKEIGRLAHVAAGYWASENPISDVEAFQGLAARVVVLLIDSIQEGSPVVLSQCEIENPQTIGYGKNEDEAPND